jgi:hypothetical protein
LERNRCCGKCNNRNAHRSPNPFEGNAIGYGSQDPTSEGQFHTLADPPASQEARTRSADGIQPEYQSAPYDRACYPSQAEPRSDPPNLKSTDKPEQGNGEHEERQISERDSTERVFRRKYKRTRLSVETRKEPPVEEQVDPHGENPSRSDGVYRSQSALNGFGNHIYHTCVTFGHYCHLGGSRVCSAKLPLDCSEEHNSAVFRPFTKNPRPLAPSRRFRDRLVPPAIRLAQLADEHQRLQVAAHEGGPGAGERDGGLLRGGGCGAAVREQRRDLLFILRFTRLTPRRSSRCPPA